MTLIEQYPHATGIAVLVVMSIWYLYFLFGDRENG